MLGKRRPACSRPLHATFWQSRFEPYPIALSGRVRVRVCVCVCAREREREGGREGGREREREQDVHAVPRRGLPRIESERAHSIKSSSASSHARCHTTRVGEWESG